MKTTDRTKRIVDKVLGALADEIPEAHPLDYLKEFVLAAEAIFYVFAKGYNLPGPTIEVLLQALAKDVVLFLRIEQEGEVTEKDFIDAYIALCKGFGFYVGSCGCCDSPFISKQETHGPTFVGDKQVGRPEYDDVAGHEAHLRGLSCLNCDNGGYVKARYGDEGKTLCAECGKELEG